MKRNIVSTTKLAEICGVSQGTVDRALNNRPGISPKTKERILRVAKEFGYRPNIHASSMSGGKSMLIGVVVFNPNDDYFGDLLNKLEEEFAKKGYSTIVMFTHKNQHREKECIDNLYHMSVDGIVLCPICHGEEYENYLLSLDIPIVTVGNKLEKLPYSGMDEVQATTDALCHVISNGYEKLVFVTTAMNLKNNSYALIERLRIFENITKQYSLETEIIEIDDIEGIGISDGQIDEISKMKSLTESDKKTAFVCSTDIYALRLLPLADKLGAGIIGFNDVRSINTLAIKLDSVAYNVTASAKAISDYLIDGNGEIPVIEHKIIKRGSI